MFRVKFIIVFISISYCLFGQDNYYFPQKKWQSKNASELKFNKALLDSATFYAQSHPIKIETDLRIALLKSYANEPNYKILGPVKPRGNAAGLIIKDGYIAAQWGDIDRVDMSFSATKSFLSSVAGLALDHQLINSVEDNLSAYITNEIFDSPHNAKIKWKHLLEQNSDWSGCQFDLCDWADRPPKTGTIDDWKNRPLLEPGSHYEYNDVRVNLLAYSLLQVFRKPLPVILKEMIMDPIGCTTTWRWNGYDNAFVNVDGVMTQSVSGGGHHGGGLFINTLDMARYGYLFLRNGNWHGKQLLSNSWIEQATKPSQTNPSYGYLWWNNSKNEWPGLPLTIFYAVGYGGNYIIIDKSHDLVIVLRWMDSDSVPVFMKKIVEALN